MGKGVRVEITSFLRQLPPIDGGFRVQLGGPGSESFNMPYETLTIDGQEIQGLRENKFRLSLLDSILNEHQVHRHSLLDIGSNLGTTLAYFRPSFKEVYGLEGDMVFFRLCLQLYPDLPIYPCKIQKLSSLKTIARRTFSAVFALSMIEYVPDKFQFASDLFEITQKICIVEGHSEDIHKGVDRVYEEILKDLPWTVTRRPELTDPGLNAPKHSRGRPVWTCVK
jgi:hypothetical protein